MRNKRILNFTFCTNTHLKGVVVFFPFLKKLSRPYTSSTTRFITMFHEDYFYFFVFDDPQWFTEKWESAISATIFNNYTSF